MHCTGWKNCSLFRIKPKFVKNGCLLSNEHIARVPGIKIVIWEHNFSGKNIFFGECFCWVSKLSLLEMDQESRFGGTIGYGDSYLESLSRHFNVFRLHAILHDAAGAVRAHSGKVPGYCYVVERGSISCLLGQMTALFFCLYVKLFLPSVFISVDLWSKMYCTLLDIELQV